MTTDHQTLRERLSFGRAVLAAVLVLVVFSATACTTKSGTTDDTVARTTTQAATGSTVTTTTPASDTIGAKDLLRAALDRHSLGYRFEELVTVGSEQAAVISGFVVGQSTQMGAVSGEGSVTYVITPDAAWICVDDGEWDLVDSSGPIDPPLDALAQPDSITVTSVDGNTIVAVGMYRGADFDSDDPISLSLKFEDGFLVSESYTTGNAIVITTFSALAGETITTPTP